MHDVLTTILEAMLAMPAEAAVTSAHPRWFQRSQLRLAHLQQPHALLMLLQRVKLGGCSLHCWLAPPARSFRLLDQIFHTPMGRKGGWDFAGIGRQLKVCPNLFQIETCNRCLLLGVALVAGCFSS